MNTFIHFLKGSDLEACLGFPIPGRTVDNVRITHDGNDAITLEWVRLFLDDSTYLICPDLMVSLSSLHGLRSGLGHIYVKNKNHF